MSADVEDTTNSGRGGLTRRQFLPGAAGIAATLGVAGTAGYELLKARPATSSHDSRAPSASQAASAASEPPPPPPSTGFHSFVTRPDLRPPLITVSNSVPETAAGVSPRFVALSCGYVDPTVQGVQSGPLLVDRLGRVVWFRPMPGESHDMQVQSYNGRPVITWWTGLGPFYHDVGTVHIVNGSYKTITTIDGAGDYLADPHEFVITSRGTGLFTTYVLSLADLTSQGGPRRARVWAGHVLEVDIATGKLLLDWDSLEHIPVSESYVPYQHGEKYPYDYLHLNSVSEMEDGNLLISSRHTWTLYAVDRSSGKVLWRMGGKSSDFQIPPNARFAWQHHARTHGSSMLTVFDNGSNSSTVTNDSKGLMLSYDVGARTVKLIRAFRHPARLNAWMQGSVQTLPNGNVFVGWGAQPYYSMFRSDGTMLTDATFSFGNHSYRAFLVDWVGHPTDKPAVVAKTNPAGGFIVYVSWNGATEVATWTVLAGSDSSTLHPVATQPWAGLETAIVVNSQGPVFQVVAHDRHGKELGRSEVV